MLIIDGSLFFILLFFAIPVLAVRDIIRAIRKFKRKRDIERLDRLIQKNNVSMAEIEKDHQEFKQWEEEHNRQRDEQWRQWEEQSRELEAAIEAASDLDEYVAALEQYRIHLDTYP